VRNAAVGVFWTVAQTLLAVLVAYLAERRVTMGDVVTALLLAMLGTGAFLVATHPRLWKKVNVSVAPKAEPVRQTRQNAEISGGGSAYQAGRDMTVQQAAAPADEFRDAPYIAWGVVRSGTTFVDGDGTSPEVEVLCTVNRDVLPDPRSSARSSNPSDRVSFEDFDVDDLIRANPGTFTLRMRLWRPETGDRTVTWRVVYFDTAIERGYVTECSVPVTVLRQSSVARVAIREPRAMDRTSPRLRHQRYTDEYGTARHARST
jgi:hypothetical protein